MSHFEGPHAELLWYVARLCWWAEGVEERMSEFSDQIDALKAQVDKSAAEEAAVIVRVAALEEALANASAVDPAVQASFDALKASVQTQDDLVADPAPVEEPPVEVQPPAEEAPVEETPAE